MNQLLLKIILTPALIGAASLAGRRWGPGVSGWLVGLPFTSGPITFYLALGQGAGFARAAALGSLTGTLSQAAFCLAYAWLATRARWPLTVLAGGATFLAVTFALQGLSLPLPALVAAILLALAAALRLMPRAARLAPGAARWPRWDLPARMVVATGFVVALTGLAPALGPRLTGLLAPFPIYASILAAFAHQQQGPAAAAGVLRGLLLGLFAFTGFYITLAGLLQPAGLAPAFAAALAVALGAQGGALWVLQWNVFLPLPPRGRGPGG